MINLLLKLKTYGIASYLSKLAYIAVALLCVQAAHAQNFTLTVTPTPETCPGNGSLAFSVANAATSPPVRYKVYHLPDTTTAISDNTNTSLSGQTAGDYKVIATQVVNGVATSDEKTVTIDDHKIPFVFSLAGQDTTCGNDGVITVTVTSGTAVSYQIISGPVTTGIQSGNVFNNLPAGSYMVQAADACGSAPTVYFTLFNNAPVLQVGPGFFPNPDLSDCTHIKASNLVAPLNNGAITYPVTATYTIYPPGGGAPQTISQTIATGDPDSCPLNQVIPFYFDTPYYYTLLITDGCGTPYTTTNPVNEHFTAGISFVDAGCGKKLIIGLNNYVAPFTVTFTQTPTGWNPADFNAQYPAPFTDNGVEFGDDTHPIPLGTYAISVTDACGHSATSSQELVQTPIVPISQATSGNCNDPDGKIKIYIPARTIDVILLTAAPAAYTGGMLPQDLSAGVNGAEGIIIDHLPAGTYTFSITDNCGHRYDPLVVTLLPPGAGGINAVGKPDCAPGLGTVYIGPDLTSVIITAAPAGFTHPLPYDVSFNINTASGNSFYMEALPPGSYSFTIQSACAGAVSRTFNIAGNFVTRNDFTVTPHCGSFDLEMHHTATPLSGLHFWLQKEYGNNTGIWGHPGTGTIFTGTVPDSNTAVELTNNTVNYSLIYPTGHYRVVKAYSSFTNGSTGDNKNCLDELYDFNYYNSLLLLGVENLTCTGTIADVAVHTEGIQPITYTIIQKNGQNFTLSNGTNNIFYALESAIYTVEMEDPCGHKEHLTFNVAELPTLVNAYAPPALTGCDNDGNGTEDFNLFTETGAILNGQNTANVSLTYHATNADAQQGINPLPSAFTAPVGTTTLFARVAYNPTPATCYATTFFDITVSPKPQLLMQDTYRGCEGVPNTITADAGFATYTWSTGELTQSISPIHEGDYTVQVTTADGCTAQKTVHLATSVKPQITDVVVEDWTDNDNVITIEVAPVTTSAGSFEYSVDGVNYQANNTFTGLEPGLYTVYVRDTYGCGNDFKTAYALSYPKYFTPNGDSQHETWRIKFAKTMEKSLMVFIYDRYGKLITGFDSRGDGWDGTLNGAPLPATDYWFVVKRADGRELKGHFSLIR